MTAVLIRTLAVFKLREIGIHKDAVEATSAVESVALQRVAPTVVALRADVMCNALVNNNLQAVVVVVLIGFDDPDVAIHWAGCRRTKLGVEGTAIVNRAARIGITACLGQVSTAGPRDACRLDVELRSVDVVVDRGLAIKRTNIVDAQRCASAKLLLNTEVELDGVRPAVVRIKSYILGERKECCNALRVIEQQAGVGV